MIHLRTMRLIGVVILPVMDRRIKFGDGGKNWVYPEPPIKSAGSGLFGPCDAAAWLLSHPIADLALYLAGGLTLLVALAHGWLGATKVVGPTQAAPSAKRILHALMFLSAVYWFAAGLLLLATPSLFAGDVRYWVVIGCVLMLGGGGIGNVWAMRGRHFGGYALLVISALALFGALFGI